MTFETREQLMRDFDAREERLDTIRANYPRCHECGNQPFSTNAGREIERSEENDMIFVCWRCIDDIVCEALR